MPDDFEIMGQRETFLRGYDEGVIAAYRQNVIELEKMIIAMKKEITRLESKLK